MSAAGLRDLLPIRARTSAYKTLNPEADRSAAGKAADLPAGGGGEGLTARSAASATADLRRCLVCVAKDPDARTGAGHVHSEAG